MANILIAYLVLVVSFILLEVRGHEILLLVYGREVSS
jgi:hypothetical protein